jgi:hypothetical protein
MVLQYQVFLLLLSVSQASQGTSVVVPIFLFAFLLAACSILSLCIFLISFFSACRYVIPVAMMTADMANPRHVIGYLDPHFSYFVNA